jgi:hypothetical protein
MVILVQIAPRTGLPDALHPARIVLTGEHQDRSHRLAADLGAGSKTTHAGEDQIEQDQIHRFCLEDLQTLLTVAGDSHSIHIGELSQMGGHR